MKTKSYRLTRQAQEALVEIVEWTIATFGHRQADLYEDELIARCEGIADGRIPSRSCNAFFKLDIDEDLRFVRAGEHFIIFIETAHEIIIIDFLHARADLSAKIYYLTPRRDQ